MGGRERAVVVQVALAAGRKDLVPLPVGLHTRMGERAAVEGRSLAGMVRWACERYLEAPDVPGRKVPEGDGKVPEGDEHRNRTGGVR